MGRGVGAGEERRGVGRVARGPAGEMLVFRPDLGADESIRLTDLVLSIIFLRVHTYMHARET